MAIRSEQRRGMPGWIVVVALCLGFLGAAYLAWERLKPASTSHRPPEAEIVVRYEGRNWVPVDPALATHLPDDRMVRVGQDGRRTLWANTTSGLGGGGGGGPEGLATGPYHRIWVKLPDGRFLPMRWLYVPAEVPSRSP